MKPALKWKDVSSFSQSDKIRTPKSFSAQAGPLRVTVSRHLHYAPTDWLVYFERSETPVKGDVTLEVAQLAAEQIVREYAQRILDAIR